MWYVYFVERILWTDEIKYMVFLIVWFATKMHFECKAHLTLRTHPNLLYLLQLKKLISDNNDKTLSLLDICLFCETLITRLRLKMNKLKYEFVSLDVIYICIYISTAS